MTHPIIVYISGPMTTGGNFPVNIRRGIEVAAQLVDRGYVVICPHEKAFGMEMLAPRGYEDWMKYDFLCIEASHCVLRMSDERGNPLPSSGGDRECEYARSIGLPVYYSIDTLLAGMPVHRVTRSYPQPYRVDVGNGSRPGLRRIEVEPEPELEPILDCVVEGE